MSSTLYRLGRAAAASPVKVIVSWLVMLVLTAALAVGVGTRLDDAFSIPGTQSQEGLDTLATRFPELGGTSGQVVFVTQDGSPVTDHKADIQATMREAGTIDGIETATDPFDEVMAGETSADGTAIIANLQLDPALEAVPTETQKALETLIEDRSTDALRVYVGGQLMTITSVPISLMEVLGVLAALVVLSIAFKALRSAFIPIVTALTGIGMAMLLMFAGTSLFTISSTAPTLAVMLGLAVGIDYALFVVSRHLDQLRDGLAPVESIARATATSGSAVIFAGMTVIIALVGLFLTQIPFLTVMGIVSALAVGVNVIAALTLLPAILGLFGERIRPRKQREKARAAASTDSPVGRRSFRLTWVRAVTKFPVLTIVLVMLGLGAVALPAKDLGLALPDQGTDAAGTTTREAYDIISDKFGPGYNATIMLTADIINTTDPLGVVDTLKEDIEGIDGVQSVQLATPNRGADMAVVVLHPEEGPSSESTKQVVQELRGQAGAWERELKISDITVTGSTAIAIDITDRLSAALLPFGIFVVGLSLVLLAMVFRSMWVPLKAAAGFLLSIGAAFGVTSMVFTYGWGADLLHVASTGPVISFLPIIVMGVLFGLAMDYEVFLVTRMREEYIHGRDARAAIERGFVGSAPVVIAAAAIMVFIFASFIPESTFMMQPIALALAVGVFVDAYIVRMTLVPAILALLGDRAWRFPAWLDRLLPHMDVEGEGLAVALEHRDWSEKHGAAAVRLKDVSAPMLDGHGTLGPLAGALDPGSITLVASEDRAARDTFLALAAARLEPTHGTVFLMDRQVPGETAGAQKHTVLIRDDVRRRLRDASTDTRPGIIYVLDSLNAVMEAGSEATDTLARRVRQGATVVIGLDTDPDRFLDALPDASVCTMLDLDNLQGIDSPILPAHTTPDTAEARS
ncbi:MAG: MMPL family transporter [Dermabacter sp.]|nr:MMPL family transporter [Dermabacter sp.]